MKKIVGLLLVLLVGYAGIFWVSRRLENSRSVADESFADEDLYFSANQLKLLGSDFKGLLADWYWVKSLQYIGDKVIRQREKTGQSVNINDLRPLNPRLVYPMLDSATTLDPQFMPVYSYGAAVLTAIDNDQAIKLLEKGITANPEDWRLYHNLGYIYWQTKNYQKAAELYAAGATKPDAPVWMKQMSVNMQAQGGNREFAMQIYRQMYESAEDEQTKSFAELRYNQKISEIQLEAINQTLQSFKEKSGRCAGSLKEVLPLLSQKSLGQDREFQIDGSQTLVDPTKVPYSFDGAKCQATLNFESKIPKF